MGNEIKLKVAEAVQDDVNKGIVRLDSILMKQVGVRPGDIVGIKGERETVAVVDRSYPGDVGLNIIRMDGLARRNATPAPILHAVIESIAAIKLPQRATATGKMGRKESGAITVAMSASRT